MRIYRTFITFILLSAVFGCASTIDVKMYTFGSPMHHVYNGIEFLDMGFMDDAFREFSSAIKAKPYLSPGFAGKGIYWSMLRLPDVSRGYIILARKNANSTSEEVFAILASMRVEVTIENGDWFEVLSQNFDEVMDIDPNRSQAYYWMGLGLYKSGDTVGAVDKLKKVVDLGGRYKKRAEDILKELE